MNDQPDAPDFDPAESGPEDRKEAPADIVAELRREVPQRYDQRITDELGTIPRPINWRTLTPEDLEAELLELNEWVDWLRHTYGLPAQIVPPMWHRHPELLWELSALRQHWLFCYDRQAKGNQALAWHQDFAAARDRLRDWTTTCGTRLDRDRPTRVTAWPGGEAEDWAEADTSEKPITDRNQDSTVWLLDQVAARRAEQDAIIRDIIASEDT